MSKRFYYDEFLEEIYDKQIDDYPSNQSICGILNQQAQRISELEEQLKNSIRPKFKIGQEVWVVLDDVVAKDVVANNWFLCSLEKSRLGLYEDYLFATKEEAQAKLKELQGEIK